MNSVDPYLKAREVAAEFNISVASVYRRIADGKLPKPVKLGACARWPQSMILAAKAAQEGRGAMRPRDLRRGSEPYERPADPAEIIAVIEAAKAARGASKV